MISYLSGTIIRKDEKYLIINVSNVGYKVLFSSKRINNPKIIEGKTINAFCYTNTKKDPWEIYGFFSFDELDLFEFLIKIPGIGPRAALQVSPISSLEKLKKSVQENDAETMNELFSLGNKKAQAIIFEISRKLKENKKTSKKDKEVIKALEGLGFSSTEAKDVVSRIPESIVGVEERIKEALKETRKS